MVNKCFMRFVQCWVPALALVLFLLMHIFQFVEKNYSLPSSAREVNGDNIMAKKSIFSGLVEARQRQANRHVNGYLLSLDDETLKAYGYDRKKLAKAGSAIYAF